MNKLILVSVIGILASLPAFADDAVASKATQMSAADSKAVIVALFNSDLARKETRQDYIVSSIEVKNLTCTNRFNDGYPQYHCEADALGQSEKKHVSESVALYLALEAAKAGFSESASMGKIVSHLKSLNCNFTEQTSPATYSCSYEE